MKKLNTQWKTQAFGLRALKVHYELLPLVTVIGIAAVGCAGFCVYSFLKPDVMFSRKDEIPSWMRYSPDTRQKLFTIEKNWKKDKTMEEVERLRKEIGSTH
uniref:Putative normal mucosa of esophagus-specific protein n=1 Tax=Ixodes ricinus TaxID=34613 RepID=V5HCX4_IXORI